MEERRCLLNHVGIHIRAMPLILLPLSSFKSRMRHCMRFFNVSHVKFRCCRPRAKLFWLAKLFRGNFLFGALGCGHWGRGGPVWAHAGLRVGPGPSCVARAFWRSTYRFSSERCSPPRKYCNFYQNGRLSVRRRFGAWVCLRRRLSDITKFGTVFGV